MQEMSFYQRQKGRFPEGSKIKTLAISLIVAVVVIGVLSAFFEFISLWIFKARGGLVTLGSTVAMILNVIVGAAFICKVAKLSIEDLGWHKKGAAKEMLQGLLGGFIVISVVALVIFLLGGIKFQVTFAMGSIPPMVLGFVFFMFQGTLEELVMRSYLMPSFAKVMGDGWSMVVTSILFAALHAGNPNMGAVAMINLALFGMVFAIAYDKTGSLWVCGIGHGIWNYGMSYVYGAEVSGLTVGNAVLRSVPQVGKELISGGSFGYEGGLVTTAVGVILIILLLQYGKAKPWSNEDKIAH